MIVKPKKQFLFKEEENEVVSQDIQRALDVNYITSVLMSAKVNFHVLHFQTRSYAKHKALETLYEEVTDKADEIIECLLGRLNIRLEQLTITSIPFTSSETESSITDQINFLANFSEELFTFGNDNNYQDIANLAAELQQLVNQTKYRLTLS